MLFSTEMSVENNIPGGCGMRRVRWWDSEVAARVIGAVGGYISATPLSWSSPVRRLIGLLSLLALALAACDGGTATDEPDALDLTETSPSATAPPAGTPGAGTEATQDAGTPGDAGSQSPAPGTASPAAPSGTEAAGAGETQVVDAGQAGEVDVQIVDGQRLELGELRLADGWTHQVEDSDPNEIELELRHTDGSEIDLDIELVGGRLEVDRD